MTDSPLATMPQASTRLAAILESDSPARAVEALASQEIYALINDLGFEECKDLIGLMVPEQVQACLDLATWNHDKTDTQAMQPWLATLCELGHEQLGPVWAELDAELRALWLQRQVTIFDAALGEAPTDDDDRSMFTTPDSFFVLAFNGDDASQRLCYAVIEHLYRYDPVLAQNAIMAARSEGEFDLEEMLFRWRTGRLADLGYLSGEDAQALFLPLELRAVPTPAGSLLVADDQPFYAPHALTTELGKRHMLADAISALTAAEAEAFRQQLTYLANRILAAGNVKPGDAHASTRAFAYATATLELALEALCHGSQDLALAHVRGTALPLLFRAGYTLGDRLHRIARRLVNEAAIGTLSTPAAEVVAALAAPRPMLSCLLDNPPEPGVRPMGSLADLRLGSTWLMHAAVELALADSLHIVRVSDSPQATYALAIRTGIGHLLIGHAFSATPLSPPELQQIAGLCRGPIEPLEAQVGAALARHLVGKQLDETAIAAYARHQVAVLHEALVGLHGPIDARFVGDVIAAQP